MTDKEQKQQINKAWIGVFAVLGGFFRAWFGGSFGYCWRWVKYLVLFAIVLCMYWSKGLLNYKEIFTSWEWCVDNWRILGGCISFAIHWALSHGMFFKYWDKTDDAENRHPLLVKFVMWLCGGPEQSRTFWGNFVGMTVRYTLTAILVAIIIQNWWFCLAGLIVGICYIPAGLAHNTKIGEYLAGASNFALLWWCL